MHVSISTVHLLFVCTDYTDIYAAFSTAPVSECEGSRVVALHACCMHGM